MILRLPSCLLLVGKLAWSVFLFVLVILTYQLISGEVIDLGRGLSLTREDQPFLYWIVIAFEFLATLWWLYRQGFP